MIKTKSKLTRIAAATLGLFCLGSTLMAGPGTMPMLMMMHGKMMMVMPMTKDMTYKSGTKVCMNGMCIMPNGKKMKLKEGDMVSSEGMPMKPAALKTHGG